MSDFKASSHLYAGFIGGLSASVALQPLDLLKTRVQQAHGASLRQVVAGIHSVPELWRGTLPSAVRMSVGASLYLTLLGALRARVARLQAGGPATGYSSDLPKLSMQMNLALGALARSTVGFITMPATIVKIRYESSLFHYKSIRQALRDVYQTHGLRGFFAGYGPTVARDAPYAGLYVLFYEKSKDVLNLVFPSATAYRDTSAAAVLNTSSAVLAATLATIATAPFDTIKTKVQLEAAKYRSFWTALGTITRESGWLALFDGVSLRLTRKALSAGISWCVYEEIVRRIDRRGSLL